MALSYSFVVLFDFGVEFFKTLISSPKDIFDTRCIHEIQLFSNTISSGFPYCWDLIPFLKGLISLKEIITTGFSNLSSFLTTGLKTIWINYVGWIEGHISPVSTPSLLQPIIGPVVHAVSSGIALYLLRWFLRVFFGI